MTTPGPDAHGQAALLLCESLIHVLIEGGIVSKEDALGAIATVTDVREGMAADSDGVSRNRSVSGLLRAIASSIDTIDPQGRDSAVRMGRT